MGTRSTVKFIAKRGEKLTPLVNIYQQFDGYIEGVGYDLANWLKGKKIINGISMGKNTDTYANGFECLIAQFIRDFKKEVGGLYITDIDNSQEYDYQVIFDEDKYFDMGFNEELSSDDLITIKVNSFFEGTPSELLEYKESEDDE
ncbi:MAG: hypothetical protein IJ568_06215 [Bacilli bacterium]|nr:hypothetical protein [Bacilli bacterium]